MLLNNGNAVDTSTIENNYDPIPDGWYLAQISKESERPTSKGGKQLVYEFTIIDGQYSNRKVFCNYNLNCPGSEKAEQIARDQICTIAKCLGITTIRDTSENVDGILQIHVAIENREGYEPRNIIKGYKPDKASAPATPSKPMAMPTQTPQPVSQPVQMSPKPSSAPWARK